MSIKSDRWIRRMADEYGMIEPFEPGQVRENGGDKIVSYGTSSYGYDVRCSNEFKISPISILRSSIRSRLTRRVSWICRATSA